jgi:DNA-binding MarR family transcriptional regulator/GNAT superfamily N-acetyltransferase
MAIRPEHVEAVRRFSRFYTRQIGLLEEGLLKSPFSLTEARVLWELAHRDAATATELSTDLALDGGYLSRVLRGLQRRGVVERRRAPDDGRKFLLSLTPTGRDAFAVLDAASRAQIGEILARLETEDRPRLVDAMGTVETLLDPPAERGAPWLLRPPHAGDLGWIVQRHGQIYAEEYGWDHTFEAMVAGIVSDFVRDLDPERERCWIAERDGRNVGSVMVVKREEDVAQLRCLIVEASARGLGIGRRLVEECIHFAREHGYRKMMLWTVAGLDAARRIYEAEGFALVREEAHPHFGYDLVDQVWERDL